MGAKGKSNIKEDVERRKNEREKTKKKKEEPKVSKKKILPEGVRGIVRVAETDLDGSKKLYNSLLKIKGIGGTLSLSIPRAAGIDPNTITGTLTDEQLKKIETTILNPSEFGIPVHSLNRRKDKETGECKHLVSSKLALSRKFDIDTLKKIHAYRGIRHEAGLPVRGQRTRSSFRRGAKVGVSKKAFKKGKVVEAAPKKEIPKLYAPKVLAKPGEKKEKKS